MLIYELIKSNTAKRINFKISGFSIVLWAFNEPLTEKSTHEVRDFFHYNMILITFALDFRVKWSGSSVG